MPGASACRTKGRRGAFWALLGPDVEFVRTDYDVDAAAGAIRAVGYPERRRTTSRRCSSLRIRRDVSKYFESLRGRSYVHEARRRVGPKRERIRPDRRAPRRGASRRDDRAPFGSDVELLFSVILSAQTTDVNVNRVTERLFEKYRRLEDYLAVPVEELERDIYETGFFRQKAKSLRGTARVLLEEFDGIVPRTMVELLRLPGVARKTANVVAAELGDPQGIVVDTHVRRLSQRLGLTRQEDPVRIERDLVKLVPREDWGRFPHLLIWHGRRVCDARRPRCEACVLSALCPSSRVDTQPAQSRHTAA